MDPEDKVPKPIRLTQPKEGEPNQSNQRDALSEAKRLMAEAEAHERRVTIHEESAQFLDERGEHEQGAVKRREADLERDAARTAWDRAHALQGPTQVTEAGLEIPIPSREDFLRNLNAVSPKLERVEQDPALPHG